MRKQQEDKIVVTQEKIEEELRDANIVHNQQ